MRCPKCGSENVQYVTTTDTKGPSVSQGCCGWIIFGPVGLLCSFCGSGSTTKKYWVCNNCGTQFQKGDEEAEYVKDPSVCDEVIIPKELRDNYKEAREIYDKANKQYYQEHWEYIESHRVLNILFKINKVTIILSLILGIITFLAAGPVALVFIIPILITHTMCDIAYNKTDPEKALILKAKEKDVDEKHDKYRRYESEINCMEEANKKARKMQAERDKYNGK